MTAKSKLIKDYLRMGHSPTLIAQEVGVNYRTVMYHKNKLAGEGARKPQPTRSSPEARASSPSPLESPIDQVLHDTSLSQDSQRRVLSEIADSSNTADNTRVAAIRALAYLEQLTGNQGDFGPGPPQSQEEKIFRLSLMVEACDQYIVKKALEKAYDGDLSFLSTGELVANA